MDFTTINGIGFKGLNSDIAPWELDPEFITSGLNFRLDGNRIISTGSHDDWSEPTSAPSPDDCGHVFPVKTSTNVFWIALCRTSVLLFDGSDWHDITSTYFAANPLSTDNELLWNSCTLGKIPVINNPQHVPEVWQPQSSGTIMTPLPFDASNDWVDLGYSCDVIRSHKNFLFALSINDSGVEIPSGYRWSHPADINGLPYSWDPADTSSLAGREQLGGDSGRILDGLSLRDSFCMYSENGINIFDYTGDEFVWRRRELSSAYGIIATNCVASVKGVHYVLSDGDILLNDGNRVESAVHNRITKRLTSQMSVDYYDRSFVVRNVAKKEIWFCVPEEGALYPNVAYVYNWKDDSWSIQELPYDSTPGSEVGIAYANYGERSDPPVKYNNTSDIYATTLLSYGSQQNTPLSNTVIGVYSDTGGLSTIDPISSTVGNDTGCTIERTDILIGDQETVKTITRIYPYSNGPSPFNIRIGSQAYAGAPIEWGDEVVFDPTSDRKIDLRATGVLFAYRISTIGEGSMSLTGLGVQFADAGKR